MPGTQKNPDDDDGTLVWARKTTDDDNDSKCVQGVAGVSRRERAFR